MVRAAYRPNCSECEPARVYYIGPLSVEKIVCLVKLVFLVVIVSFLNNFGLNNKI